MIYYITKYALTVGIQEMNAELCTSISEKMIKEIDNNGGWVPKLHVVRRIIHKPYWYETKEEAIKHAEQLKAKKIASLKKQIEKLEKINF